MLIVDAQVHIWRNNKPTNPAHRQVSDFAPDDLLARLEAAAMKQDVAQRADLTWRRSSVVDRP